MPSKIARRGFLTGDYQALKRSYRPPEKGKFRDVAEGFEIRGFGVSRVGPKMEAQSRFAVGIAVTMSRNSVTQRDDVSARYGSEATDGLLPSR